MHLKIIAPGSNLAEPQVRLVKASSRGLIGADLHQFLKSACHEFVEFVNGGGLRPGEVGVHLVAMGCTEKYGPNRNGDGFKEASLKRTHSTFTKHAKFYRDHLNRQPEISYGRVVKSAYNDAMHRVELLVALNETEKAAKLNEGLVANWELEKLASGNEIPVSMSCTIPFDVCSGCGNQARTRADYCDDTTCKYGGLKHNIAKVASDGHILHADNPNPRFFDISHVFRPADRIAYTFGKIEKAASYGVLGGAQLAEECGLTLPLSLLTENVPVNVAEQIKIAATCAGIDRTAQLGKWAFDTLNPFWYDDRALCMSANVDVNVPEGGCTKEALCALAKNGIVLSPSAFVQLLTGEKSAAVVQDMKAYLPGVFDRLLDDVKLAQDLTENPFTPSRNCSWEMDKWARDQRDDLGLDAASIHRRTKLASIRSFVHVTSKTRTVKSASENTGGEFIARKYALYKIAALQAIQALHPDFPGITASSVRQHYVI